MPEDVSSNNPFTQYAEPSRVAALLRPYLYPINRGRSALPHGRLDALSERFIQ